MIILELTNEQQSLIDEYASKQQALKSLTEEVKGLREQVDVIVEQSKIDPLEQIQLKTGNSLIDFAKTAEALKFNYDMNDFLIETNRFDLVDVNISKAKKELNKVELQKYFKLVLGSRRATVQIL